MLFQLLARCIKYTHWVGLYEKICGIFNSVSDDLYLITHGYSNIFMKKYWITKNEISMLKKVDFENIRLSVIDDYESVLRRIYGDYMQYPPLEKRGKWHDSIITFDPDISYRDYLSKKQ